MVWIIIGSCAVVFFGIVWWKDRRHHGRVDHRRVYDGITSHWDAESFQSRRDRK